MADITYMKILLGQILYDRKISYRQLSIMTEISKSNIENICDGKRFPRIDTLEKIAKALNMHIVDLFESDYK